MRRRAVLSLSIASTLIGGGAIALVSASDSSAARCVASGRCAAGVSILSAPNPSAAGGRVTIVGRVQGAGAGTLAVLWHRLPGWRRFHRVLRTRTARFGDYAFVRRPGVVETNRWFYVVADGRRSRTVEQRVRAVLTLSASNTSPAMGDVVTFSGQVTPSHAGNQILLEQDTASGWTVVGSGHTDSHSRFAIVYSFT